MAGKPMLLLLPRELRDIILSFVLEARRIIFHFLNSNPNKRWTTGVSLKAPLQVQIIRVNKQLHAEATEVLLKVLRKALFIFGRHMRCFGSDDMHSFFNILPQRFWEEVQSLQLATQATSIYSSGWSSHKRNFGSSLMKRLKHLRHATLQFTALGSPVIRCPCGERHRPLYFEKDAADFLLRMLQSGRLESFSILLKCEFDTQAGDLGSFATFDWPLSNFTVTIRTRPKVLPPQPDFKTMVTFHRMPPALLQAPGVAKADRGWRLAAASLSGKRANVQCN